MAGGAQSWDWLWEALAGGGGGAGRPEGGEGVREEGLGHCAHSGQDREMTHWSHWVLQARVGLAL